MRTCITIPIEPVAKGRPRFGKHGAYTPAKTRKAEETIRAFISPFESFGSVPVCVDVMVLMPIPKSWPKKKREAALAGDIEHTGKPDLDNLAKLVLDRITRSERIWRDDSQVVSLTVHKFYAVGSEQGCSVSISTFEI